MAVGIVVVGVAVLGAEALVKTTLLGVDNAVVDASEAAEELTSSCVLLSAVRAEAKELREDCTDAADRLSNEASEAESAEADDAAAAEAEDSADSSEADDADAREDDEAAAADDADS